MLAIDTVICFVGMAQGTFNRPSAESKDVSKPAIFAIIDICPSSNPNLLGSGGLIHFLEKPLYDLIVLGVGCVFRVEPGLRVFCLFSF
jgi:hypothetical protein